MVSKGTRQLRMQNAAGKSLRGPTFESSALQPDFQELVEHKELHRRQSQRQALDTHGETGMHQHSVDRAMAPTAVLVPAAVDALGQTIALVLAHW